MRIEINQLEQFNRLASRGADRSAASLTQLTGLEMRDEMTTVSLVTKSALEETFSGQQYVGVQVGLDGGLSGETVLIFEPESADEISQEIPGASAAGSMSGAAFAEIGNMMIGGFVDGWANHLGVQVDVTPPTYLEATGTRILPRMTREEAADEGVFLFQSQLEARNTDLSVPMYLIPEYDELVSLLAGQSEGPTVPAEKLTIFNDFAEQSAERASEQIAMLTGLSTDVDVSQLRFMSLSEMAENIGQETHIGSVFEMDGLPSGYFLLLFDMSSANAVASAMMPGDGEVEESQIKPAIEELGNILTSGFVDGWANTLETTIEHSPPEYVRDAGETVINDIVGRLDGTQDSAFTIDSAIEIGGRETQCRIYVLPDQRELTKALQQIPGQ